MSERQASSPNCRNIPDALELPKFEDLSDEQKAAIRVGPGWVHEPVELYQFADVEDFRIGTPSAEALSWEGPTTGEPGLTGDCPAPAWRHNRRSSNSFKGLFTRVPGSILGMVAEGIPAFQRFSILYPDVVAYMHERVSLGVDQSDEVWAELLQVYRAMAKLVDRKDPYVVGRNGDVDELYLTR